MKSLLSHPLEKRRICAYAQTLAFYTSQQKGVFFEKPNASALLP